MMFSMISRIATGVREPAPPGKAAFGGAGWPGA